MIARREALSLLLGCAAAACRTGRAEVPRVPAGVPLQLNPLVDLVPAAGLVWLVEARPRDLAASRAIMPVLASLASDDRTASFARRYGVSDLRKASELVVAGFEGTTLGLAALTVELPAVEKAFIARADAEEGRAVERGVTRFWGTVGTAREQVAVFEQSGQSGQTAVGIERGRLRPLQAAIALAENRLRRSRPALRTEPLQAAAARVGDGPIRAFAPGPFEGEWASGFGGLLQATTAFGAVGRPLDATGGVALRLVLTGAWGGDAGSAAERLGSAFRVLAEDPLGRLTGIDRPLDGPRTTGDAQAVTLDVVWDVAALARGIKDATDATAAEMMAP